MKRFLTYTLPTATRLRVAGAAGAVLLAVTGCQLQSTQTTLAPDHPANPAAASAPTLEGGSVFDLEPGRAIQSPAATGASATQTDYVCPMHPQVRQDQPGKCPICQMILKPEHMAHHEEHP